VTAIFSEPEVPGDWEADKEEDSTDALDAHRLSPISAGFEILKEGRLDVGTGGGASMCACSDVVSARVWSSGSWPASTWSCTARLPVSDDVSDVEEEVRARSTENETKEAFLVAKSVSNFLARALALLGRTGGGEELDGGGVDRGGLG